MRIPAPRADLQIERSPDRWLIRDAVTQLAAPLSPPQIAVFQALSSKTHTPESLVAAVPEVPPAQIFRVVKALEEGLILDGARWQAQRALFEAEMEAPAPQAEAPLSLHEALAHQCVGCGSSCYGVDAGPVPPHTVDTIDAHGLWRDVEGAERAEDCVQIVEARGHRVPVMARQGGGCVMLGEDGLCRVHGCAGPEAKPGVCSQFPITLTRTPEGIAVGLQMECRSFLPSAAAGAAAPMEAREAEIRALLRRDVQVISLPTPIPLAPGVYAGWAAYQSWWAATVAELEGGADLGPSRRRLEALVAAHSEAWAEGESWRADAIWPPRPTPSPESQREGLLQRLGAACEEALMAHEVGTLEAEMLEQFRKCLMLMLGFIETPPMRWADASGPSLLRTHLLADVHGHQPLLRRDLSWGLGRLALISAMARGLAALRAWQSGRTVMHGQDVNDGLVVAQKVLRSPALESTLMRVAPAVRVFL